MLWFYLHFPSLLLEHYNQSQPDALPMALIDPHSGRIVQANSLAADTGVTRGQSLQTATALTPTLKLISADGNHEEQILQQQALWLYRFMARIIPCPPAGLLAEAGSLLRLHGGLHGLWQKLEGLLVQRRFSARLAYGYTPLAARLLAENNQGICTDEPETLKQAIGRLPVDSAGLDQKTAERLQRMGLSSLQAVFQLPDRELARRLGPEACRHLQKIRGTAPDPQKTWTPPGHFRRQLDFAQDVEHSSGLAFPLHKALQELEDELRWRQQSTDTLQLSLRHRDQANTALQVRTTAPEHRADAFIALIRLRLDQTTLSAPVIGLTLRVRRLLSRTLSDSDDLLGESSPSSRNEAWQHLLSRLQTRLGEEALHTLSLKADHRPELATGNSTLVTASQSTDMQLPRRPLWLLKPPHPLTHMPDEWLAGPERISAGWWDGERIQRDYYIARLTTGQTGWLFRDVTGGWFVHGWFG